MEPDPVLVSNTREWLLRAQEDLDNAQHDLLATPPFVRDALFQCQQVAEKAMKGGKRRALDGACSKIPISWRALGADLAGSAGVYRAWADLPPHHSQKAATSHYQLR